jgi:hypothetical protein
LSPDAHAHPEPAETRNGLIVLCGVIFTLILVFVFFWLRSYFYVVRNEISEKKIFELTNPKLTELRAAEEATLSSYGWIDKEKGIVRIPIQEAMEVLVREGSLATGTVPEGESR